MISTRPRSTHAIRAATSSLALIAALATPRPADACGTMVFQSHAERPGGMDGQELFLSLAPDTTTLVLSASFIDAAGDKAFLLPIAAAPDEVRDADEALFVALETGTIPVISISEAEGESVSPCTGDRAGGGESFGGGTNDVEVLDRGSTATYDYVVVGGDTGSSLAEWLNMAGFGVPTEFEAALDDYAGEGWYFLAATLNDDAPEGHLAPLELRLPATPSGTTIPFGIAAYALAPSDAIDITLYLASPATILPQNYAVQAIAEGDIEATSETTSNYQALFDELVSREPTWVVEYSYGEWTTSSLDNWVDGDEEYGINLGQDVDAAWLTDFHQRLGYDQARLTRLRTRLTGADLVDLTLAPAEDLDVDRDHYVTWDPRAGSGCGVTTSPAGALLCLGALALVRRRRRESGRARRAGGDRSPR